MPTPIYDQLLSHVQRLVETAFIPQVFIRARDQFLAGKPYFLTQLLRGELGAYECRIAAGTTPGSKTIDVDASAEVVRTLIEEIAAHYGNELIWCEEQYRREDDQAAVIASYVTSKMRGHTDSGDESLDWVVQAWHDAEAAFSQGDALPLLRLVADVEGYEACQIANILMARLAGLRRTP